MPPVGFRDTLALQRIEAPTTCRGSPAGVLSELVVDSSKMLWRDTGSVEECKKFIEDWRAGAPRHGSIEPHVQVQAADGAQVVAAFPRRWTGGLGRSFAHVPALPGAFWRGWSVSCAGRRPAAIQAALEAAKVTTISSDRTGAGNAVSPPLVPSGTRGRGHPSIPGRRHAAKPLSRCWPRPAHTPTEGSAPVLPSHLRRASDRIRTRAQEPKILEIPITPI